MKLIINLVLVAIVAVLAYFVVQSIREPIEFKQEKDMRTRAVTTKLMKIRDVQEMYRDITGRFAPSWDTLSQVMRNDQFTIVSVEGDPDDPRYTGEVIYDTVYIPAIDTIRKLDINLDSLKYVPYGDGATFSIQADTMTYQNTKVSVVEVGIPYREFMGEYGDPKFAMYDDQYNPDEVLKFGDMNKPNLSGNW